MIFQFLMLQSLHPGVQQKTYEFYIEVILKAERISNLCLNGNLKKITKQLLPSITGFLFLSQASRTQRIIMSWGQGNLGSRMLNPRVWVYRVLWRLEVTLSPVISMAWLHCSVWLCQHLSANRKALEEGEGLLKQLIKAWEWGSCG